MRGSKQLKRDARRLFRLCLVDGRLDDDRARNVARSELMSGARDGRRVVQNFLRLLRIDRSRHSAEVESATPLTPDLRNAMAKSLQQRFGAGLITTFRQRPELIGGVRIQCGCDVYDDSVLAGLSKLGRRF